MFTTVDSVRIPVEMNEIFVVENRFSESSVFECLGHVGFGVTDLYWTISRDGAAPIIPEVTTQYKYYNIFVGDNYLSLTIDHSVEVFRGFVRCSSRTAPDEEIIIRIQGEEKITKNDG